MRPLKLKVLPKIPARIVGTDGIAVSLAGGIYTIALDEATLLTIANLVAATSGLVGELRVVTGSGSVVISSTEGGVAINKTVGAATTVQLPLAAPRNGVAVIVVDMKGDALSNNITVLAAGAETINGAASAVLNSNKQAATFRPISGVGWLRT